MKFRRHATATQGWQVDIAPMIDMVFQLLIFFMLTASYITQEGIQINLPRAASAVSLKTETLVVTVDRDNHIVLRGERVSLEQLRSRLRSGRAAGAALLIRADELASLGTVVSVWDLCRDQGFEQVNIATLGASTGAAGP